MDCGILPGLQIHCHRQPSWEGQYLWRGERKKGTLTGHQREIHSEHRLCKINYDYRMYYRIYHKDTFLYYYGPDLCPSLYLSL